MALAEVIPAARKLSPSEKLKLIRILVEDLDAQQDIPISDPITNQGKKLRPFGLCAGEFVVPEDFDAPLPEEILSAFEGK